MNQLLSITNALLSDNIGVIDPVEHDSIEVVNQTLDGQTYVQVIGSAQKSIKFEILSTSAQVDLINILRSTGAKFKLIKGATVYTGFLLEKPTWNRITKDFHESKLKLNITEEGSL